jgi:hypothetical protein
MRPNGVRLREDSLLPNDASRPDLEALETAKAVQDESHQKLDRFIVAALAELSDQDRASSLLFYRVFVARTGVDPKPPRGRLRSKTPCPGG